MNLYMNFSEMKFLKEFLIIAMIFDTHILVL